jgi:hypothetical protein
LFHHPGPEVGVWNEEDGAVRRGLVDDPHGVAGGADDIAEGFDAAGAINIGNDVIVLGGIGR